MICSAYIATSLDGYIARENGNLDWLDKASENIPEGEDCGYDSFISDIDVIVMGRNTYEKVLSFGLWPYENIKVIVLTHKELADTNVLYKNVEYFSGDLKVLIERLRSEGIKRVYIDGGVTITNFLAEGLLDEIIVTVVPVILGKGIPLFGSMRNDVSLELLETETYDFGFLQIKYKVLLSD